MAREVKINEPTTEDGVPGRFTMIRGEPRFIPDTSTPGSEVFFPGTNQQIAGGSFGAGTIALDEFLTNFALRGKVAATTIGQIGEVDPQQTAAQREFADVQALLDPLEAEHPLATGIGQSVPGLLLPQSKAVNTIGGFAEGALALPENPILGGTLSATGAFLGGEIGQRLGVKLAARADSALGALARRNIPTTVHQRTGREIDKGIETGLSAIPVLSAWARAPLRAQQRALNEGASSVFGFTGKLNPKGLGTIKFGMQKSFQEVENAIPSQQLAPELLAQLDEFGVVDKATKDVLKKTDGVLDGEGLMKIRSELNDDMADAFIGGNRAEGRALREALNEVDTLIKKEMPLRLQQQWRTTRQQWQFFTALKKGKAVSGDGTVNLASMNNALKSIYPNFRVGADLPAGAQGFGELVQALDELPKAMQSSGSAERAIAAAILTTGGITAVAEPGALAVPVLLAARAAGRPGTTAGAQAAVSAVNPIAQAMADVLKDSEDDDDSAAQ